MQSRRLIFLQILSGKIDMLRIMFIIKEAAKEF
jgi:hypothetical protein